jgi:hypothetical protein
VRSPSAPPETISLESSDTATERTADSCPGSSLIGFCFATSQTTTTLSPPAATRRFESGKNASEVIGDFAPVSVASSLPVSGS